MRRYLSMSVACLIGFAVLALPGCATLDGIGARVAASDVSIVETAIFVREVSDAEFDLSNPDDRIILYRAIDTYAAFKRGNITREQAEGEVFRLIRSLRPDTAIRDPA